MIPVPCILQDLLDDPDVFVCVLIDEVESLTAARRAGNVGLAQLLRDVGLAQLLRLAQLLLMLVWLNSF